MEYIIYCDESVSNGKYYTDFFGGVLVRNKDYDKIRETLDVKKLELNLKGEIKWVKVTENYLEKYKQIMDYFFSFIKENSLKVRIMFRETDQTPPNLSPDQIHNKYSLLYYQFVKNAFGLIYHDGSKNEPVYLRLYFDAIPYPIDQRDAFKSHIFSLQRNARFRKARIKIRMDDIVEINSSKHSILQCMDIVLGSMSFILNRKNEVIPVGAKDRGHRTIAKEKLFHHIIRLIQQSNEIEFFDISKTTPISVPKEFWTMPYRHWKFTTPEYRKEGGV
ncbi:MAG: DUF3800 domain-containing protein [Bacteroidales bacterium]|nr:DUF3800 domain-containing protein [Bacteroidales bacterium]